MPSRLSQRQRTIVALSYFILLLGLFKIIGSSFGILKVGAYPDSNIWFYSGAFMIILGVFLLEPYFTTPSNAVANSTVTLIALLGLTKKHEFYGYWFVFTYVLGIFVLGIAAIMLKDAQHAKVHGISLLSYFVVKNLGSSRVIFSVVYIFASMSYFDPQRHPIVYLGVFLFWISITFRDVVSLLVRKLSEIRNLLSKKKGLELGLAIGCENEFLFRVEVDDGSYSFSSVRNGDLVVLERQPNRGVVGIVVDSKVLLNKSWLSIYLLQNIDGTPISLALMEVGLVGEINSIFERQNLVYLLDLQKVKSEDVKEAIMTNPLYLGRNHFIGYVTSGTNINTMNFSIVGEDRDRDSMVREGSILKTFIYGKETLFQIINGNTRLEHLENLDQHGFTVGIARKLGQYIDAKKELDVSKWMPEMFAPVLYAGEHRPTVRQLQDIAQSAIGRLPDTSMEIPIKDIDAIVTHNTAILGILGIGKSYLAYELMMKVVAQGIKVICIDITNEYIKELPSYLNAGLIEADSEGVFPEMNATYGTVVSSEREGFDPELSGNFLAYRQLIRRDLCRFLFDSDDVPASKSFDSSKMVRIYNVDYHKASKGEKLGYHVFTTDLTQAEKTRIIAAELFTILMKIPLEDVKKAKVLLVFEEAHSLIPEWNSVAYDGDKVATSGTSKYILQGRKYGLGSLIITQRTSNVSKSILNQCNTIFALRVFDDTGKIFLENYIGKDYADTLATLEERHAIVIGKGLKLKQPVIVQLNDRKDLLPEVDSTEVHDPVQVPIDTGESGRILSFPEEIRE